MNPARLCKLMTPVLLGYYVYTLVVFLDLAKTPVYHHFDGCKKVQTDLATEDFAVFGRLIIGATGDSVSTFYKHLSADTARPGYLMSIDPVSQSWSKIDTHGLPPTIQMNAHGITLFNNKTLYVISHSWAKGGELIILFDLSESDGKITAVYNTHYSLPNDYGLYNGIAVIDPAHFYLTQWVPFADTVNGRDNSLLTGIRRTLLFSYTKSNGIKLCTVEKNQASCEFKARGYIPNGIVAHNGKIFVGDSAAKTADIYEVQKNFDLVLVAHVPISHVVDNLHVHNGEVYIVGINKLVDYILYGESVKNNQPPHFVPGGFSRVFFDKTWQSQELVMQNLISLPSSIAIIGPTLTFTSIVDDALLFCPSSNLPNL
jgi:hypothetical protein